jgi:hypothetical protein
MLSHKAVLGSLDAYADGTLPGSQRAGVAAHLQTCAECGESLRKIHRLDQMLDDMPPMPAVPFARFWSRLEPRLPGQAQKRAPVFRPARLAAGFALAVLASLVGVVALASDGTLPDSPLYSVKHLRQGVQLSLADAHQRPRLDLRFGIQRLKEAKLMLQRGRDDLAVASLRDFKALIADATPLLEHPGPQTDAADVTSAITEIKTDLTEVSAANHEPDTSTAADIAAVDDALQAAQTAVTRVEDTVEPTAPAVLESPSPAPVSEPPAPAPAPTAQAPSASPSETPSPEASPSAAATDALPTDAAATPAP